MAIQTIYLAAGCFWGVDAYYRQIKGVVAHEVGYANSKVINPSYKQVKAQETEATEAVKIDFDDEIVSLRILLKQFFKIVDPFSLNKQGLDEGTNYRSGIYYVDEKQLPIIKEVYDSEQAKYEQKFKVELLPLKNFYKAEEYHQNYLIKNPQGYCHTDFSSLKDLDDEKQIFLDEKRFVTPDNASLQKKLDEKTYSIVRKADTEPAFSGEYDEHFKRGIYVDITNGAPLFVSSKKYNSGCGWPAFSKPIDEVVLTKHEDHSIVGRDRIEVRSKTSGAHLGHVFNDGPKEQGGLRYCINSKALKFIAYDDLEKEGYKDFKKFVE